MAITTLYIPSNAGDFFINQTPALIDEIKLLLQKAHSYTMEDWKDVTSVEGFSLPEELKEPGNDLFSSKLWLFDIANAIAEESFIRQNVRATNESDILFWKTNQLLIDLESVIPFITRDLETIIQERNIKGKPQEIIDNQAFSKIYDAGGQGFENLTISEFEQFLDFVDTNNRQYKDAVKRIADLKALIGDINAANGLLDWSVDLYAEEIGGLASFMTASFIDTLEAGIDDLIKLSKTPGGQAAAAVATVLPGGVGLAIIAGAAITAYNYGDLNAEATRELRDKLRKDLKQEALEAAADNLIYSEQCFMLTNLDKMIEYKKSIDAQYSFPYLTYQKQIELCGISNTIPASNLNQPISIEGEPFSFMNKMAVEPDQKFLFDIMPHEISSLTPNIELYKVISEDFEGELIEYEQPIRFDINTISPRMKDIYRSQRGTGVGMKSFKFAFEGTDPFSAKKAISADLSIFASSFADLIELGDKPYRYTDLALKTGGSKDETVTDKEREQLDKLNFRLKAVVQWSSAPDSIRSIKRKEIKKALYNSAITLYLTPVTHTFDFDENGGVTFNISYRAYIEDFFTNENFNVFSDLIAVNQTRKYVIDYFKEQNCNILTGEDFKLFQQADSDFIINKNSKSLNSIIEELTSRKAIKYINMTYTEIENWMRNPAGFAQDQEKIPISDGTDGVKAAAIVDEAIKDYQQSKDEDGNRDLGDLRMSLVANSQINESIPFFYLGDLVSVVMNLLEHNLNEFDNLEIINDKYLTSIVKNLTDAPINEIQDYIRDKLTTKKIVNVEQFKKMRIVLGPMEISNNGKFLLCSVADIPISLNYFIEFLSDKVIAKELTNYPISKFIKDIINQLIRDFLNSEDCSGVNTSQKISMNSTTIVGYDVENYDVENYNIDFPEKTDSITNLMAENIIKARSGQITVDEMFFDNKTANILLDKIPQKYFPLVKISADRNNPNTHKDVDMMTNFYVFSVGRSYPTDKYIGDREIDASSGIFHYMLGEDRGIVKSIKLQKTNTPGLKEVRFEQQGYEGLEQLREVYNVGIECYLNPQAFPGTYIYVSPEGFAPDVSLASLLDNQGRPIDLTQFGIGGYYMITSTKHSVGPGEGTTSIEASWVASKDGTYGKRDTQSNSRGDGEGTEKVKKCKINARANGNSR